MSILEETHPLADEIIADLMKSELTWSAECEARISGQLRGLISGEVGWALLSLTRFAAALDERGARDTSAHLMAVVLSFTPALAQETATFEAEVAERRSAHARQMVGGRAPVCPPRVGEAAPEGTLSLDHFNPHRRA